MSFCISELLSSVICNGISPAAKLLHLLKKAFCGVLLDFCARTWCFLLILSTVVSFRDMFPYSRILLSLITALPYKGLTRDTDTAHYCQISLQCYFAIQNKGTDTVQLQK